MSLLRQKQEELYNSLIALRTDSHGSFAFWLSSKKKAGGEYYRFNCGGIAPDDISKGYTDVGIVKLGCSSYIQFAGFQFKSGFTKCEFRISNRPDADLKYFEKEAEKMELTVPNKSEVTDFVDSLQSFLNKLPHIPSFSPFDSSLLGWMADVYNLFFEEVESYDANHNTSFKQLLWIDQQTFSDLKTKSENKLPHTPNTVQPKSKPSVSLNQILYGPPGTGKTYNTVLKAMDILEPGNISDWAAKKKQFDIYKEQGQIVFTTFHQSMSYEDFVEGIKPVPNSKTNTIEYSVVPGIFKRLCDEAGKEQNKDKKYVLIIDEINRGNVSQIFGELITLLEEDKRIGRKMAIKVKLPYSIDDEDFGVPDSVYIIGTMNTADRSVEALDTALRRRFSFIEMMPKPDLLDGIEIDEIKLNKLLEKINERIEVLKDREHQIGHSYFMECKSMTDLMGVFKDKIVPLLQEYFYGNYENILLVLGEGFVEKVNDRIDFAVSGLYDGDIDKCRYRLKDISSDDEFKKALLKMLNPNDTDNSIRTSVFES